MMVFGVRDARLGGYPQDFFFFAVNEAVAIRQFQHSCEDERFPFLRNPEDYALYKLGWCDKETGQLTGLEQAFQLTTALEQLNGTHASPRKSNGQLPVLEDSGSVSPA